MELYNSYVINPPTGALQAAILSGAVARLSDDVLRSQLLGTPTVELVRHPAESDLQAIQPTAFGGWWQVVVHSQLAIELEQ